MCNHTVLFNIVNWRDKVSGVVPKLLITLGVHGAVQFTTGITKSKYIVAINNNPKDPIFDIADYGFVGDAKTFVEALLKLIQ